MRPRILATTVGTAFCAALLCGILGLAPDLAQADPAPVAGDTPHPSTLTAQSPSTPAQVSDLDRRLAAKGLARGGQVLIRIFKEESELELWMRSGDSYRPFSAYPICRWRGALGPKLVEGDRQSPEGFYSFGQDQLMWQGHWFRAFNINYPNTLDRALGRTGSGILIHGACSSIGCYAMTDPVIDEIFDLVVAAFAAGQARVQVHIFPFHMTLANLARHEGNPWSPFWRDLKPASDLFVSAAVPPKIGVCDGRYVIRQGQPGDPPVDKIVDWCGPARWQGNPDRLAEWLDARRAAANPPEAAATAPAPSGRVLLYAKLSSEGKIPKPEVLPDRPASYGPSPDIAGPVNAGGKISPTLAQLPETERAALLGTRTPAAIAAAAASGTGGPDGPGPAYSCNPQLPACRHFIATHPAGGPPLPPGKLAKR